jgi:hypothetical protein
MVEADGDDVTVGPSLRLALVGQGKNESDAESKRRTKRHDESPTVSPK